MKDRLQKILQEYDLTPSRLAEKLGVQRSGISHIMSGRNKPSYDFLIALMDSFPDINANWLLTGKGEMLSSKEQIKSYKEERAQTQQPDLFSSQSRSSERVTPATDKKEKEPVQEQEQDVYKSKQDDYIEEEVEAILVLMKNGKFKRYRSV